MRLIKRYIKLMIVALSLCCGTATLNATTSDGALNQTVVATQPQVRVVGSRIEISVSGDDDLDVTIYALTGQVVKTLKAIPGVTTVELPKGYYIVKCDRISCRVVLK